MKSSESSSEIQTDRHETILLPLSYRLSSVCVFPFPSVPNFFLHRWSVLLTTLSAHLIRLACPCSCLFRPHACLSSCFSAFMLVCFQNLNHLFSLIAFPKFCPDVRSLYYSPSSTWNRPSGLRNHSKAKRVSNLTRNDPT